MLMSSWFPKMIDLYIEVHQAAEAEENEGLRSREGKKINFIFVPSRQLEFVPARRDLSLLSC